LLERFSDKGREAVAFAQDEAAGLGHAWIGTEHILLGLLRQNETVASEVLRSLDLTPHRVRSHVVRMVGIRQRVISGAVPFVPPAKRALDLALQAADHRRDPYIEPEHILLGLLYEPDAVAARALVACDTTLKQIRDELRRASGL
jgi:ATP-dependent Clp protease ATP-binding subunit ClpC